MRRNNVTSRKIKEIELLDDTTNIFDIVLCKD